MVIDNPSLFVDIADALSIDYPAIVEKDYYAVQLLKKLLNLEISGYQLVFCGGTCLAKVHRDIFRMSEDLDIKLDPSEATIKSSRSEQRKLRKNIHNKIIDLIEKDDIFDIAEKQVKNEYRFLNFQIRYPKQFSIDKALRSELQLELTESLLVEPPITASISSLYAKTLEKEHEIHGAICVTAETIASEKFVALLRRTAAWERDNSKKQDDMLIRHVYDLHHLSDVVNNDPARIKNLVKKVIEIDQEHFRNQQPNFAQNPFKELKYGLKCLIERPIYQERYNQFIGPLVYDQKPANWDTSLKTLRHMANMILT